MSVECIWRIEISSCQPRTIRGKGFTELCAKAVLATQIREHEILALTCWYAARLNYTAGHNDIQCSRQTDILM
jgi:hypothetical protein